MFALSCCHDKNSCVPSNSCMNNNVEETQLAMQQDVNLSSSKINWSSSSTTHCLMAKSSSSDDNNNDNDNNDEEDDMEKVNALLQNKGLIILKALPNNKNALSVHLLTLHLPVLLRLLLLSTALLSSGIIGWVTFVAPVYRHEFVVVFWGLSQEMSPCSVKVVGLVNRFSYLILLVSQCLSFLLI